VRPDGNEKFKRYVEFIGNRTRELPACNSTVSIPYPCLLNIHLIQGVSRLEDITAGGDFLGLCNKKSSYKHVSDFGRLRSYGHFLNSRTRPRVNRFSRNQLAVDVLNLAAYLLR